MSGAKASMPELSEAEQRELESLGISVQVSATFIYKGHKYQSVDHAIAYARLDRTRAEPDEMPVG